MKKSHSKFFAFLLALAMAVGLLSGTAHAASVQYREASYNNGKVTYTEKTASNATVVGSSTTSWDNGGWYVVSGEVTISNLIAVSGDVNLILADGATLSADKGIEVTTGDTLNIYAQSGGTGRLTATGSNGNAGIGRNGSAVIIHGGIVTAVGRESGWNYSGGDGIMGDVTVYNGSITATGGMGGTCGFGIRGDVTVYNGSVTATGGSGRDGGRKGGEGISGNVTINNGSVTATGGKGANSSNGQDGGNGVNGDVTVNNGSITATGGSGGSGGIDGAKGKGVTGTITAPSVQESDNGTDWTTLSGSTSTKRYVKAETSSSSVPVEYQEASVDISGNVTFTTKSADTYTVVDATTTAFEDGNWYVVSGEVTISNRITVSGTANLILCDGATLTADKGITVASGGNTLNIYGQTVGTGKLVAAGDSQEAGIGGTEGDNGDIVNIHGGTVIATGARFAAGIGGGMSGEGGNVTIYRGSVTANGGEGAAGIGQGKGDNLSNGNLTVYNDLLVTGGTSANPKTLLASPYSTRARYMKVFNGYTVSFDKNNDSATGSMDVQIVEASSPDLTLPGNSFDLAGYTFNGWNTSADGTGTGYADKATITLTANITLYAQWKPVTYAITYDLDGGTVATANPTNYDITSPDITLKSPTKTGYTFAKWTSGDTAVTSIPKGSTGNLTLKANWTANTYTVKFNSNGGTGSMSDLTLTYDVEETLSDNKITRTGYTFNNWKDNASNKTYNGGASVKNLTAENGATITLYAQWTLNQYTLTFNTDGGSAISAITQDYGTAVTAPADPAKEGYTFNGWDKEIPSTMPAENLTFTAQWKENEKTPASDPQESDPQQEQETTDPQTDPQQEQETTDPQTEEPVEEKPESETADATAVSTMDEAQLQQTFENKTEITLTGSISNENLSAVIEKIASVTEVKTLDLSQLKNVTEVKLPETVKVESITVAGNETITKVEVQNNTSLKSINLSASKVETVDAKGCTGLTEVVLTSCDELQSINVSETPITKLDTSNCEKLLSIDCSSCDISELNIDGCKKLADLNCANNSLSRLDVSNFSSLSSLECEHQVIKGFRKKSSFNILDILFRAVEAFITSDANTEDNTADLANVKDITGIDKNGNELSPTSYDDETGEVVFSTTPETIKYNYRTGFENKIMDVTVETSGESQQNNSLGGSGGGCNVMRNEELGMRNVLILLFFVLGLSIRKSFNF